MATRRAARHGLLLPLSTSVFMLCSCGGAAQRDGAAQLSEDTSASQPGGDAASLPDGALDATWQELGVAAVSNRPGLAATPQGYYAVSRRTLGDAKAPSAYESYLYRSTNGARWQRVAIASDNQNLWLRGVAYGAGHYVLAGMRMGGGDGVIFHSTDGERFDEIAVATGAPSGLSDVVFAGDRFFALSTFRTVLTSTDGTTWLAVDLKTTVAPNDVAFGDGRYVLVGSGDVLTSTDGRAWAATSLDCSLPGACITDPSGHVSQGVHSRAVFAAGTFFIDEASSTDARSWRSLPGAYPRDSLGGRVVGSTQSARLATWSADGAAQPLSSVRYIEVLDAASRESGMRWNGAVDPNEVSPQSFPNDTPPDTIDFPLPSGADCTTSPCVVVDGQLYLIGER